MPDMTILIDCVRVGYYIAMPTPQTIPASVHVGSTKTTLEGSQALLEVE